MHEANAATSLVTPSSTALLWQSWTGMTHLGTVGGSQSYAQAVNSIGKVVGYGKMASAARDAFVWRRN